MCCCLSRAPYWGPGPQLRHVPCLGIKPVTLGFAACAQSTEPLQPGQVFIILYLSECYLVLFNLIVFVSLKVIFFFLTPGLVENLDHKWKCVRER